MGPLSRFALAVLIAACLPAGAEAAEPPLSLGWSHLVPPEAQAENLKSRSFLAGARPPSGSDSVPQLPAGAGEADWMSYRWQQPGADEPPKVVEELDGKRVRIGGYVVALDFDATSIREFLLVPFVGACIHVPPPPPNQIIYVKSEEGFEITGQFDPVYVTGTMKTGRQVTGLAATGYTIEAEKVETRAE